MDVRLALSAVRRLRPCEGADAIGFVISLNLHRRHLTESQRAVVGAKLANLSHGQKKSDTAIAVTQSDAAAQLSVSEDSIQRARKVLQSGDDDLIHAVERVACCRSNTTA